MKNDRGNVLYLGIAISYLVIAFMQIKANGMFPMRLYLPIAMVSFEITLLEMAKTIVQRIQTIHLRKVRVTQQELSLCERHIAVFSKYKMMESETEKHKAFRERLVKRNTALQSDKWIRRAKKVINVLSVIQVVVACILIATSSLKQIPNDLTNNKIVGVLSLLSFSFLIMSYYLQYDYDPLMDNPDNVLDNIEIIEKYYLDILEKVSDGGEK